MAAGGGNFQSAFYLFLALYLRKIGTVDDLGARRPGGSGGEGGFSREMPYQLLYIPNRIDRGAFR